jgi:hypothetical protein
MQLASKFVINVLLKQVFTGKKRYVFWRLSLSIAVCQKFFSLELFSDDEFFAAFQSVRNQHQVLRFFFTNFYCFFGIYGHFLQFFKSTQKETKNLS